MLFLTLSFRNGQGKHRALFPGQEIIAGPYEPKQRKLKVEVLHGQMKHVNRFVNINYITGRVKKRLSVELKLRNKF